MQITSSKQGQALPPASDLPVVFYLRGAASDFVNLDGGPLKHRTHELGYSTHFFLQRELEHDPG